VNWDDEDLLVTNAAYRGFDPPRLRWMFTTFHMGHYQPLTWLTFALDHRLGGMEPYAYHLGNVALHAANTVLVYALASRIPGCASMPAAALAALSFAVHPLRVESVAWVTERRDVLSTFFLLLTLLAWFRRQEAGGAHAGWYGIALVSFALSLLSKAWGMTL